MTGPFKMRLLTRVTHPIDSSFGLPPGASVRLFLKRVLFKNGFEYTQAEVCR